MLRILHDLHEGYTNIVRCLHDYAQEYCTNRTLFVQYSSPRVNHVYAPCCLVRHSCGPRVGHVSSSCLPRVSLVFLVSSSCLLRSSPTCFVRLPCDAFGSRASQSGSSTSHTKHTKLRLLLWVYKRCVSQQLPSSTHPFV